MTTVELIQQAFGIEQSMTRLMLERVPCDRPDWTPHLKSMPLGKLALHVAMLPGIATVILTTTDFDVSTYTMPQLGFKSPADLLCIFAEAAALSDSHLAEATDGQLAETWTLRFGERVLVQTPRGIALLHNYLGHLIHHRAQLGTYLRLNDIAVPGVYGPSADEKSPS